MGVRVESQFCGGRNGGDAGRRGAVSTGRGASATGDNWSTTVSAGTGSSAGAHIVGQWQPPSAIPAPPSQWGDAGGMAWAAAASWFVIMAVIAAGAIAMAPMPTIGKAWAVLSTSISQASRLIAQRRGASDRRRGERIIGTA